MNKSRVLIYIMPHIYAHISNLIGTMFPCEHCKKYWKLTESSGLEILLKRIVSTDSGTIRPKICGNCPPTENLHTRKSEEIVTIYAVETTLAIIIIIIIINNFISISFYFTLTFTNFYKTPNQLIST